MDNEIRLYKVPWNIGSINQPYFLSDLARDNYFDTLENLQVNEKGVNINISFNYSCSVKVNIDITLAEKYNFAILLYNNVKFYCSIIDCAQISVGYTNLELKRHILTERTNFLSYFKNFTISKATFPQLDKLKMYDFRDFRYRTNFRQSQLYTPRAPTTILIPYYTVHLIKCVLIFVNDSAGLADKWKTKLYGEPVQYNAIVIPLEAPPIGNTFYYYKTSPLYETYTLTPTSTPWYGHTTNSVAVFLNSISPYIMSVHYTVLPIEAEYIYRPQTGSYDRQSLMPFSYSNWDSDLGIFKLSSSSYRKDHLYDDYYTTIQDYGSDYFNPLGNYEIYVFNKCNSIPINGWDYAYQDEISVHLDVKFVINPVGTSLICTLSNSVDGIIYKDLKDRTFIFSIGDSTTFSIDSKSLFYSENKYYDAITRNTIVKTAVEGYIQTNENMNVGGAQIAMGSEINGVSNIIRGIFEPFKAANKINHYKNERELLAKQEQAKPDVIRIAQSATASFLEFEYNIYIKSYEPFPEDIQNFYKSLFIDGVKTFLSRQSVDINEFLANNSFVISATAERNNVTINNREYSEMENFLDYGVHFFLVE